MIYALATAPPGPESITISSRQESTTLEINSDYVITIALSPEQSEFNQSLTYHINNADLASFKESDIALTATLQAKKVGEIEIYVSTTNVESNPLFFNIVDSNTQTEKEEKQKFEEEKETAINRGYTACKKCY